MQQHDNTKPTKQIPMKDYTYDYMTLKARHERMKNVHDAQIKKLNLEIDMLRGKIIAPMVIPKFDLELVEVLDIVSGITGVFQDDIISHKRYREMVTARALFCYICRVKMNKSLNYIGRYINRHHSSVINLVNNYDNYLNLGYKAETFYLNAAVDRFNRAQGD
jgi:chromosomal replication initiation ATPase DnaA